MQRKFTASARIMTVLLRELQEHFQAYVLEKNPKMLDIIATENCNAIERIDVYRIGYSLRLLEILEKSFPTLYKIIGQERFDKLGYQYIEEYPSHHYNICLFNQNFSQFILNKHQDLFSCEVAAFELALAAALDAGDDAQIGIAELGNVPGESWPFLQFRIHPSVAIYQFQYNTPEVVLAYLLEQEVPEAVKSDQPGDWLVWRYQMQSYFEQLTTERLWMLNAIKQNKTFAEICEGLCQWQSEEQVAGFAAGSLGHWLQKGIFSYFQVATHDEAANVAPSLEEITV